MTGAVMQFSDEFITTSATKLSTKNAWALYVRRRWPQNTVKAVMGEWDLTDGEARGVVFASISQPTIDKIIDHPRGGFGLALLILEIKTQTALGEWLQSEQERREDDARRAAAEAAALATMARRVGAAVGLGSLRASRLGPGRSGNGLEARSWQAGRPDRAP